MFQCSGPSGFSLIAINACMDYYLFLNDMAYLVGCEGNGYMIIQQAVDRSAVSETIECTQCLQQFFCLCFLFLNTNGDPETLFKTCMVN